MILHIANKNYSSWSMRPWVLMHALGLAFEEKLWAFDHPDVNRATFAQFSPTAKVPCLQDGSTVVWDSLAITEYLAERHAGVWPAAPAARAWARCAAAEMHSGFGSLRSICSMNCGVRVALNHVPADLQRDLDRIGALWADGLQRFGGPYLAGTHFTAVDAFFAPVVMRVQTYQLSVSEPAQAYVRTLQQHPAVQAWYQQALAETFRDPAHETDWQAVGSLQADLRASA
jgi:glutathione S-transferase